MNNINFIRIFLIFLFNSMSMSQTHIEADPFRQILIEKKAYDSKTLKISKIFRPIFIKTGTVSNSLLLQTDFFYNNNNPNQENMDLKYFSKGYSSFTSIKYSFNSPYLSLIFEPYLKFDKFYDVDNVDRDDIFSVLNDDELNNQYFNNKNIRNFYISLHYKGVGFGYSKANRWWGPGIHSSLQMSNNSYPLPSFFVGTINELRFGKLGFYGLLSVTDLDDYKIKTHKKFLSSLNAGISWYGDKLISIGFSRNYLSGGSNIIEYDWDINDAINVLFEGVFTSNLINLEYTVGGHDFWDQTLSGYFVIDFPSRRFKVFAEFGFNDNRMYFADFLSQPDHSMATIFGLRDYGDIPGGNLLWGFEWTNLMITYSSRHRPTGYGTWYEKRQYNYSSYHNRRWGAHSGADSDDWLIYLGFINDNFMIMQSFNYERHGIVSYRPAEVKIESITNINYKIKNFWFCVKYENQFEAFLGFPGYFYQDINQQKIDSSKGTLANKRSTNTLIFTIFREFNF